MEQDNKVHWDELRARWDKFDRIKNVKSLSSDEIFEWFKPELQYNVSPIPIPKELDTLAEEYAKSQSHNGDNARITSSFIAMVSKYYKAGYTEALRNHPFSKEQENKDILTEYFKQRQVFL